MKLGFYECQSGNVGDDLNPFLWSRLIPDLDNGDESKIFFGIGSIFDKRYDSYDKKIVFGSGARGPEMLPKIDDSWDIRFVRGPLTSNSLLERGVVASYITDPGILVSKFFTKPKIVKGKVGVIPYYLTEHEPWEHITKMLGYVLISPTLSVEDFVIQVAECELVITEAMHGAIIADAMRVPWIPYSSSTFLHENETHLFKWSDWCASMKIEFEDFILPRFWSVKGASIFSRFKQVIKKIFVCVRILKRVKYGSRYLSDDIIFLEKICLLERQIESINKVCR
ncbi:MAG: succinoglycan biosynthesis protein ExoV [Paraglaciecola sp.]|jgi:succinoglycan biosynthesis protein ExoV